jgi:hypothetical protein
MEGGGLVPGAGLVVAVVVVVELGATAVGEDAAALVGGAVAEAIGRSPGSVGTISSFAGAVLVAFAAGADFEEDGGAGIGFVAAGFEPGAVGVDRG